MSLGTAYDLLERFIRLEHKSDFLARLEDLQREAKEMINEAHDPRIVQIVSTAPVDSYSQKPFLFAIVDDGHNKDHVRFYNWIEKRWEMLDKIDCA